MKKTVDIPGYEGLYKVSDLGEIFSVQKDQTLRLLKGRLQKGYLSVVLYKEKKGKHFSIHKIVLTAFKGLPKDNSKTQVNHIDGVKTNNALNNLEWVTPSENSVHAFKNNFRSYTPSEKRRIKTSLACRIFGEEEEKEIKRLYKQGYASQVLLAQIYGCSRFTIMRIINNKHKLKAATAGPEHEC